MFLIIACVIVALLVTLLTGNMALLYGREQKDWEKHNAILRQLVINEWPVHYEDGKALNYYFAFYLPAALSGKIISPEKTQIPKGILSIWVALGLIIGFLLLIDYVGLNKKKIWKVLIALGVFVLYSGWDWLCRLISLRSFPVPWEHIEWCAGVVQYSSFVTGISWVPQHFIPALLMTFLILKSKDTSYLFLIPVLLLWSPFVAIGSAFFYVLFFVNQIIHKKEFRIRFTDFVGAALISIPIFVFFLLHTKTNLMPHIVITPPKYMLFILTELGSAVLALILLRKYIKQENILIYMTLLVLIILPLFYFGNLLNDFVMRASFPFSIFLIAIILKKLCVLRKKIIVMFVIVILLAGSITPIYEMGRVMQGKKMAWADENVDNWRWLWKEQYLGEQKFNIPVIDFVNKPLLKKDLNTSIDRSDG
jgi:hypothetical protein